MTAASAPPVWAYRITHIANVPWILDHGLHCDMSATRDPGFRAIGNPDLIGKRRTRAVVEPPGGTLACYVPFYFGTHSRMLYNIHTGYGVAKVDQAEIVHLVTSVERVAEIGVRSLFTDRHAYVAGARFLSDRAQLSELKWGIIRDRDFRHRPEDPMRNHFREAELMIYRHLPIEGIVEIGCFDDGGRAAITTLVQSRDLPVTVTTKRDWYFG